MLNHRNYHGQSKPPEATDGQYASLAARLRRQVAVQAGKRPWRRTCKIFVAENSDLQQHGRARLTVWVVANNAVNALWASSALKEFHLTSVVTCPQINRIVFTCPADRTTGYAPRIAWKFSKRDGRGRKILNPQIREFERHLCKAAFDAAPAPGDPLLNADILRQIGRSPEIQWDAIVQFLKHASAQQYLTCSVDDATRMLNLSRLIMPVAPDGRNLLTRWKAIRMLVEKDHLSGFIGGQRPLRQHGTSVAPGEIMSLVSSVFNEPEGDLAGPSRRASLIHPRYFAAAVIRRATSRTLINIGSALGGRDHATVIHGLDQLDNWTDTDPIHGKLLDVFVQTADNLGIMKQKEFRVRAISEIEQQRKLPGGAARSGPGLSDRHHGARSIGGEETHEEQPAKVISLNEMRVLRNNPGSAA